MDIITGIALLVIAIVTLVLGRRNLDGLPKDNDDETA